MNLIAWGGFLALNENAGIDGVLQYADHCSCRPGSFCVGLERCGKPHPKGAFVLHRGQDAQLIEGIRNVLRTDTLQLPFENITDNIGGVLVNDQFVFVLLVFQIPKSSKGTEKLSILSLDLKLGTDFYRNIPAIGFIFMDAIHYKVKEDHRYVTKAAYVVLGITMDGCKDILGVWIGEHESSKFWLSVLNDLKSRGVLDVYLFCTDGLCGMMQAIHVYD